MCRDCTENSNRSDIFFQLFYLGPVDSLHSIEVTLGHSFLRLIFIFLLLINCNYYLQLINFKLKLLIFELGDLRREDRGLFTAGGKIGPKSGLSEWILRLRQTMEDKRKNNKIKRKRYGTVSRSRVSTGGYARILYLYGLLKPCVATSPFPSLILCMYIYLYV